MRRSIILSLGILFGIPGCNTTGHDSRDAKRPNILLIVADDLGYADLGAFGSDIETPHIDSLIRQGTFFSRFHTAPLCAVTRAMLLSGVDNHIAGMGSQGLTTNEFGYEGHLSDRIVPMPQVLKDAGYRTCMTGKWHLGLTPDQDPAMKGFDHTFVVLEGAANHYVNTGLFPDSPISPYTEDGVKTDWPKGAYSTDLYTDKLIAQIERDKNGNQPFFAFAAYTSPHWPLQVDSAYWKKYTGRYDDGYDALRLRRLDALKQHGLVPETAGLPELHPDVRPWDSLTPGEQRKESRKMELYAGMVENLDHNIGRLLTCLKRSGQAENTLILFLADNGAAAEDFYYSNKYGPFLKDHYTDDYETMGTAESFISYGPQWAEASTAAFRYFKGYTTEGGINTPFLVSGPGVRTGVVTPAFVTVKDIAPTLYAYGSASYPNRYNNHDVYPLEGSSLKPILEGAVTDVHDNEYVFALEHRGNVVVKKANWKLVNIMSPFDEANFQLFDLSSDTGEQKDLKGENPEKYKELLADWEAYRARARIQFPTPSTVHPERGGAHP